MNEKPNLPEDIHQCSWRALRAGGHWMFLAFLTDVPGAYLLSHHSDWPLALRTFIALLPLVATLLYVRSIMQWVRGMDELHRSLTQGAFLFSAVAYLVLSTTWDLLKRTGVFEAIFQATHVHLERVPFSNCTFFLCLTYILWGIGYTHIFNRRYQ